jgi:2-dehydro-3-deoxyphosphooctonate aldolase (KDO 8-P synthase)
VLFDRRRFVLVAGPCVLESDDLHARIAEELREIEYELDVRVVFKGSFDKANRTRLAAPRGPGLARGLEMLARVREQFRVPVLTDVHESRQVGKAALAVDALQIPAFLCRQTDLLTAVAETGKAVNVKKGQFAGVPEMAGALEKLAAYGKRDAAITERGTFFGYGDLVVDLRNVPRLRALGAAVLFDGTHSLQRPGLGAGGASGGEREFVEPLVLAACAAGCDGLYLEVHPDPDRSPSDAATVLPLSRLRPLMRRALAVREAARA